MYQVLSPLEDVTSSKTPTTPATNCPASCRQQMVPQRPIPHHQAQGQLHTAGHQTTLILFTLLTESLVREKSISVKQHNGVLLVCCQ